MLERWDATITLTDNVKDENINTMGDRGIMLLNGALSLHGDRKNAWTKFAGTAKAGSDKILVVDASGWRKGDVTVLASTDFNPRQAEELDAGRGNAFPEPEDGRQRDRHDLRQRSGRWRRLHVEDL